MWWSDLESLVSIVRESEPVKGVSCFTSSAVMSVRSAPLWHDYVMPVDEVLYRAAVGLIESRLASVDWATAAALRMDDGSIRVGIALDNINSGAGLCAEVGPIAQAYTEGRRVVDSICVTRSRDRQHDLVLAPCGLCQERLALWGSDVEVGVFDAEDARGWSGRRLGELNPYYWARAFFEDERWPTTAEHSD